MQIPSSTSANEAESVRLRVQASNPLTEILVVDSLFEIVARGVHELDVNLRPALYRVDARVGRQEWAQHYSLSEDTTVEVPLLEIAAAAPLLDTARTHEYHVALAHDADRVPSTNVGSGGAKIFIMSRAWSSKVASSEPLSEATQALVASVRLRAWRGELVADLRNRDVGNWTTGGRDVAVAASFDVSPGAYVVEAETVGGPISQVLFAREGWETLTFVRHDCANPAAETSTDISVLMSRDPFDASDPAHLLAEAGRIALADERLVASERLVEFTRSKLEDPILGLIAAHLLLLAREQSAVESKRDRAESAYEDSSLRFDQSYFDEIVGNTENLLGDDHPDVVALKTQTTAGVDPAEVVEVPPLFWRSWTLLIEASNDNPGLVPEELWQEVGGFSQLRPYFSWTPKDEPSIESLSKSVDRMLQRVSDTMAQIVPESAPDVETDSPEILSVPTAQGDADVFESVSFPDTSALESVTLPTELETAARTGDKPNLAQLREWASVPITPTGVKPASVSVKSFDALKLAMTEQLKIPRGVLDRKLKF